MVGTVDNSAALDGYYLMIPNSASVAYGDVMVASEYYGPVRMGNKICCLRQLG